MKFTETGLPGAFVLDPVLHEDERGFFARTWCRQEFEEHGLDVRLAQCSVSFNKRAGTLRGMHFQKAPYQEAKLVRCSRGSFLDVIIDLREDSPTFTRHFSVVLSARNRRSLYAPAGCAHGFQTLEDDTEVTYQISEFYHPEHAGGVRWNDPAFGIEWPTMDRRIIAPRDQEYPDFERPKRLVNALLR